MIWSFVILATYWPWPCCRRIGFKSSSIMMGKRHGASHRILSPVIPMAKPAATAIFPWRFLPFFVPHFASADFQLPSCLPMVSLSPSQLVTLSNSRRRHHYYLKSRDRRDAAYLLTPFSIPVNCTPCFPHLHLHFSTEGGLRLMHGVTVHCVSRKSRKTADCNPPCLVSFRGCMEANHAPRRISVNALFFPGVSWGSAGWWRTSTVLVVEERASTSLEKP